MCERLALKESIQLLYEQITGQRAHSGEAALREASEACRGVMEGIRSARFCALSGRKMHWTLLQKVANNCPRSCLSRGTRSVTNDTCRSATVIARI